MDSQVSPASASTSADLVRTATWRTPSNSGLLERVSSPNRLQAGGPFLLALSLLAIPVSMVVLIAMSSGSQSSGVFVFLPAALLIPFIPAFTMMSRFKANRGFGLPPLVESLPQETTDNAEPVIVALARDEIVYGQDVGFLRMEGGSLYFEGMQTTFSFSSRRGSIHERVEPHAEIERSSGVFPRDGMPADMSIRVRFTTGGVVHTMGIQTLNPKHASNLTTDLFRWSRDASATDALEVFPPTSPAPNAAALARRRVLLESSKLVDCAAFLAWWVTASALFSVEITQSGARYHYVPGLPWLWIVGIPFLAATYYLAVKPLRNSIRAYRALKRDSGDVSCQ